MDHSPHRNPPSASTAPAALPTPDRAHWTPARQRIFLVALLDTGSVTTAAAAAGMNRSSAQRLRRRLAGTPFDRMWGAALRGHAARLADPFAERDPAMSSPPMRGAPAAAKRHR